MRRSVIQWVVVAVVGAGSTLVVAAPQLGAGSGEAQAFGGDAATTPLSPTQQKRIAALLKTSARMQHVEPVKAYLYLREAFRLEQLWSNNTFGEDSPSQVQLGRFTAVLTRGNDGSLAKILHSSQVALNDKLNLLRALEQEVILNYPGKRSEDLLGPGAYDE